MAGSSNNVLNKFAEENTKTELSSCVEQNDLAASCNFEFHWLYIFAADSSRLFATNDGTR